MDIEPNSPQNVLFLRHHAQVQLSPEDIQYVWFYLFVTLYLPREILFIANLFLQGRPGPKGSLSMNVVFFSVGGKPQKVHINMRMFKFHIERPLVPIRVQIQDCAVWKVVKFVFTVRFSYLLLGIQDGFWPFIFLGSGCNRLPRPSVTSFTDTSAGHPLPRQTHCLHGCHQPQQQTPAGPLAKKACQMCGCIVLPNWSGTLNCPVSHLLWVEVIKTPI